MKIAIIGAGFSGLALSYFLSGHHDVVLFDKKGIGAGSSGIAAGLLHPYVGKQALLSWRGQEALADAKALLAIARDHSSQPIFQETGILRIPKNEEQSLAFQKCSADHADVDFCRVTLPGIRAEEGIFIQSGIQVFCKNYLEGLWAACKQKGCCLQIDEITDLTTLRDFDTVVICHGVSKLVTKKLNLIKGQLLRFEWPSDLPPLKTPIVESKYIVMDPDQRSCWVGGTYERTFSHGLPDQKAAEDIILPALKSFFPALADSRVLDCQAGIRVFTPDKRPLIEPLDQRTWIFTGLGSKGLLYHAMMAKQLSFLIDGSQK